MVLSKPEEEKDQAGFYKSAKKVVIGLIALLAIIEVVGRIGASRSSSTNAADNVFLPPEMLGFMNQGLDALFIVMPVIIGIVLGIQYYSYKLRIKNVKKPNVA